MQDQSNISVKMVFREFWKGIRPHQRLFWLGIAFYEIGTLINVFAPILYKNFFDALAAGGDSQTLGGKLISIIATVALLHGFVFVFGQAGNYVFLAIELKIMAKLKQNAFDHLMLHSRNFFADNFTGSLAQRVNRFAHAFVHIIDVLVYNLGPLLINIVAAIAVTSVIAPAIALVIAAWVVFFVLFSVVFSNWKTKFNVAAAKADSESMGLLADDIANNSSITLFNGYPAEKRAYRDKTDNQARKTIISVGLGDLMYTLQIFLTYVVEFFVFYFAIVGWQNGTVSIGTFVLIQAYIIGIAQQFWGVNMIIRAIYEGIADSREMVEIMNLPHEIKDAPGAKPLPRVKGAIGFEDVSFAFSETRYVMENLNLEIAAGEKVALIGSSGTGKTTLTGLLLRLFDPAGGRITIDGQNIRYATLESLRAAVSLVPQDPVLFHRSITENIRYGRANASDAEVAAAAKLAHCDEFIEAMPAKYQTLVGERGVKLSGGERQRVAIARAILKNAPILVLDEATSSLDSRSEALIQDALDLLMGRCTTIAIAHRLSTIRKMDRIIVMENGRIAEQGSHQSLLRKRGGIYKTLWKLQAGGFIK
ncbi:MAG: ABC transporter ATP-binding protein/permease [Candidatus Pacebacteria bacterium]|jgi:ATP-binding cassette subfamily B protein|nr:ABC transporter ATP-binding protein/permease [Candidatus Paceibacterota bacterium]